MPQTHIPPHYQYSVIPHLVVANGAAAISFYIRAFGAVELSRYTEPDGRMVHAELRIEQSVFMLGEASSPFMAVDHLPGISTILHVYVRDVDATIAQAVANDAKLLAPAENMFYGARQAMLQDPFGQIWIFLTQIEDVGTEEFVRRAAQTQGEATAHGDQYPDDRES
jgi:PhnB protein